MQFWVYMLRCRDGSYYVGHTDQLEGRLWQHQQGMGCDWTMRRRPVALVWCAEAPRRDDAIAFERRIKGWTRAKKEALIKGNWDEVGRLARSSQERPSTSSGRTNVVTGEEVPVRPEHRPKAVFGGRDQ
jgi:putative endonuclease